MRYFLMPSNLTPDYTSNYYSQLLHSKSVEAVYVSFEMTWPIQAIIEPLMMSSHLSNTTEQTFELLACVSVSYLDREACSRLTIPRGLLIACSDSQIWFGSPPKSHWCCAYHTPLSAMQGHSICMRVPCPIAVEFSSGTQSSAWLSVLCLLALATTAGCFRSYSWEKHSS